MSNDLTDVTPLPRQQRQALTALGSLRDDIAILTAIALRTDRALRAVLGEIRAMHAQHSRLANRVRDLETQP
jgi:hypothetical protein